MLDDIRKALRMDSPAPRLSESNLRKLSRGLRSSKKNRLSVHSALETQSMQDGSLGGRSVSLSTLLPSGASPTGKGGQRVDKLQTLEAKMANIEVSLGWRRRREALLETLPRAARDLVRELDSLHQAVNDKETTIQSLRTQITNLGGTVTSSEGFNGAISDAEKKTVQERLEKVQSEMDSKKVAIKNLRLALDKIDISDNIDVRIRAAELEYELEREELNVLNLKEECSILSNRLQDSCSNPSHPNVGSKPKVSFYELMSSSAASAALTGTTLVTANVCHTPGNPPFHVTSRPPLGCVIDWATDDTRLKKGDRLVEINGFTVIGGDIEEVTKLMAASSLLSLTVARPIVASESTVKKLEKQLEEKQKDNKDLVARLDKALRERDNFKNDNTRLNHRICYLEDQVGELEESIKKPLDRQNNDSEAPTPSQPGATIIQVFQRGHHENVSPETALTEKMAKSDSCSSLSEKKTFSTTSSESGSIKHNGMPTNEDDSTDLSPPDSLSSNEKHKYHSSKAREKINNRDMSVGNRSNSSNKESTKERISNSYESDIVKLECYNPSRLTNGYSEDSSYSHSKYRDKYATSGVPERMSSPPVQNGYRSPFTRKDYYRVPPNRHSKSPDVFSEPSYAAKQTIDIDAESIDTQSSRGLYDLSPNHSHYSESPKSESVKCHRVYPVDRPRRFLSPSHDVSRGEPQPIKLPRPRPVPPKKPERLSLQRTTSLQSVEETRPSSRASSASNSARQKISLGWHSCETDLNTDGEITDEERSPRKHKESPKNGYIYVPSIPEERPSPTPRNSLQNAKKISHNRYEHQRLKASRSDLIDSDHEISPIYGRIRSSFSPQRPKSPDASFHLDSTLGLDHHHDVRAQPLCEYYSKSSAKLTNGHLYSPPPVPKPRERDLQAPPTPSAPPRGVDLRVSKAYHRSGEEWC